MPPDAAITRYLRRYAEPHVRAPWPFGAQRFDAAVVVPAFDEPRQFIDQALARDDATSWLLLVVVNARCGAQPAARARSAELLKSDPGANLAPVPSTLGHAWLCPDGRRAVWLIDAVSPGVCFGPKDGVGLARKIGLDLAVAHIHAGRLRDPLIRCTDADATWPPDYFAQQIDARVSALTFGFRHVGPGSTGAAHKVYDLRLRDYPCELARVGSPYGFQALGSALAISATHYAQVGGCPRRLAGEDFHLLAKLAKVGRIEHRPDTVIDLRARESMRVPFGTGPGVRALNAHEDPMSVPFFIATPSFDLLGHVIRSLREAARASSTVEAQHLWASLRQRCDEVGLSSDWGQQDMPALWEAVLRARAASQTPRRCERHVMIWFDALKTLKMLHRLRDARWPNVSYAVLCSTEPHRVARALPRYQDDDPAVALGSSSSDSGDSASASAGWMP